MIYLYNITTYTLLVNTFKVLIKNTKNQCFDLMKYKDYIKPTHT